MTAHAIPPAAPPLTAMEKTVDQDGAGQRLDKWLAAQFPDLSRSRIKSLIESGDITRNGIAVSSPASKVRAEECYLIKIPLPEDPMPQPENIPLEILYEDSDLLVLNKAAGMVVHPAPGNTSGTLVNALLYHCGDSLSGIGGVKRPGIVHRLDKDTSGVMVVAKNEPTHVHLTNQFATHSIERAYHALVWGVPMPPKGTVTGDIGRHPQDRKRMAIVTHHGKPATTHYHTIDTFHNVCARVECRLETGRTHQIRVHMTSLGHGLIGDPVYGKNRISRTGQNLKGKKSYKDLPEDVKHALEIFNRQALHAKILGFEHPKIGKNLRFESIYPSDFNTLLQLLQKEH